MSTIREHRKLFFNDFRRICFTEEWCTNCTPSEWELFRAYLSDEIDVVKLERLANGVILRSDIDWNDCGYGTKEDFLLYVMRVLATGITTTYTLM